MADILSKGRWVKKKTKIIFRKQRPHILSQVDWANFTFLSDSKFDGNCLRYTLMRADLVTTHKSCTNEHSTIVLVCEISQLHQINIIITIYKHIYLKSHPRRNGSQNTGCYHLNLRPGSRLNINIVFSGIGIPMSPQYKFVSSGIGIPMLKIRRSQDRLIFNIGIPILVRWHLYIETASSFFHEWSKWIYLTSYWDSSHKISEVVPLMALVLSPLPVIILNLRTSITALLLTWISNYIHYKVWN